MIRCGCAHVPYPWLLVFPRPIRAELPPTPVPRFTIRSVMLAIAVMGGISSGTVTCLRWLARPKIRTIQLLGAPNVIYRTKKIQIHGRDSMPTGTDAFASSRSRPRDRGLVIAASSHWDRQELIPTLKADDAQRTPDAGDAARMIIDSPNLGASRDTGVCGQMFTSWSRVASGARASTHRR